MAEHSDKPAFVRIEARFQSAVWRCFMTWRGRCRTTQGTAGAGAAALAAEAIAARFREMFPVLRRYLVDDEP